MNGTLNVYNAKVKNTIVFDIDGTILFNKDCQNFHLVHLNPELVLLRQDTIDYFFLPHWKFLFDYLMKHECRLVFFSAGNIPRNIPLMKSFLELLYGAEQYQQLLLDKQFKVFSDVHLVANCKDLEIILEDNQTIENVILVDDNYRYCAIGQKDFIDVFYFGSNTVSALLGIFMTYFEDFRNIKSIRSFVNTLDTPEDTGKLSTLSPRIDSALLYEFVKKGLQEIRKTAYSTYHTHIGIVPHEQIPSVEKIKSICVELINGKRKTSDGIMVNFVNQFDQYFEPYYRKLLKTEELNELIDKVNTAFNRLD